MIMFTHQARTDCGTGHYLNNFHAVIRRNAETLTAPVITNGMPSGTVTEGECNESTGADGAPAVKAGDDDDGGDGDGVPAPRPPHCPTTNRPRKAQNPAPLPRATAKPTVNLTTPPPPAALWRLPEVLRNVPVSRATLYAWIEQGRFPKPIKIGPRAVAWRSADVLALTN